MTETTSAARLPIGVVIVARNEEVNLQRCLRSVCGWVSEIIVALNDTTDGSEALAREFGAAVHHLEWKGFRDTKNAAMALTGQPWALCLDADEEVSPALRDELATFFAGTATRTVVGARFPRKVWFVDRWITHGDWYPDYSLRLVRTDRARWGGDEFVHEKMDCTGPIATLQGDLHHYSFPTLSHHVSKIVPFADLFVIQREARGKGFSLGAAIARPFWRFFRGYVLRLGFLDGYPGFYIAIGTAFGAFVRYSRLYEAEFREDPRG